jgi:3-deoxy-D-manno-octulosonate 8-phosphate phosphatase (KDO 8-P phosphatase)
VKPALLVFDVDGVLTDGTLLYTPSGVGQRFSARDGAGIIELLRSGFQVALLSFRDLPSTRARARDLGIEILSLGCGSKGPAFLEICRFCGVDPGQALFMGDDRMDIPALELCGFPACPADAHQDVLAVCRIVASMPGGCGAVREIADLALAGAIG